MRGPSMRVLRMPELAAGASEAHQLADLRESWVRIPEREVAPPGRRPVYVLRKQFELGSRPRTAPLRLSAQGVYEAFINGVRVGDEELTPGYTQYAQRIQVQTFEVSRLLRQGSNVITVYLGDGWFRGCLGFRQRADHYGSHVALLADLRLEDGQGAVALRTDASWRFAPSHVTSADLFRGQHEDRRRFDPSISTPEFDDTAWAHVVAHLVDAELVEPTAPPSRRTHLFAPRSISRIAADVHVVDFGQNLNGWVRLKDLGPAGTHITLVHGEALDATGNVTIDNLDAFDDDWNTLKSEQTDTVISAGVEGDVFEPRFTSKGFQFVRVQGLTSLDATDIEAVHVQSDLRTIGGFRCSDERLNWLHDAAEWSFRGNALEVPTDCPTRERSGFTGDWQVFADAAAYLFDVKAWSRRWMADVFLDQAANGNVALTSPAEADVWTRQPDFNGSAGWGDVVTIVPSKMYATYGDVDDLRVSWDAARRWVDYAAGVAATKRHPSRALPVQPHERYLWDFGFHWGEWLEPGCGEPDWNVFYDLDKSEVATAYLAHSAALVTEMARELGKSREVLKHYSEVAAGARAAWCAEFVDETGRLRVRTQASHLRALQFELIPESSRGQVAADLAQLVRDAGSQLGTGFLSTPFLLPVLAEYGYADLAYAVLLQDKAPSWLYMMRRGATTIWEDWNGVSDEGAVKASLNHYSKGAVVSFLHRYVAGLQATAPGYREFRVQPVLGGGLTSAHTWHDSPSGRIEVSWRIAGELFSIDVVVPETAAAQAVLPDGSVHQLEAGRTSRLHCSIPA